MARPGRSEFTGGEPRDSPVLAACERDRVGSSGLAGEPPHRPRGLGWEAGRPHSLGWLRCPGVSWPAGWPLGPCATVLVLLGILRICSARRGRGRGSAPRLCSGFQPGGGAGGPAGASRLGASPAPCLLLATFPPPAPRLGAFTESEPATQKVTGISHPPRSRSLSQALELTSESRESGSMET